MKPVLFVPFLSLLPLLASAQTRLYTPDCLALFNALPELPAVLEAQPCPVGDEDACPRGRRDGSPVKIGRAYVVGGTQDEQDTASTCLFEGPTSVAEIGGKLTVNIALDASAGEHLWRNLRVPARVNPREEGEIEIAIKKVGRGLTLTRRLKTAGTVEAGYAIDFERN